MSTALTAEPSAPSRIQAVWLGLRDGERVAVCFFVYLSALAWMRQLDAGPRMVLAAIPAAVCWLGAVETARTAPWSRVLRDWLSMGLILAAYWSVGWFVAPPHAHWQEQWLRWDRVILDQWALRALVESAGFLFPSALETAYLLLYAGPPICICLLYRVGGRERLHTFLFTLLAGTLAAYALLPLFPVHGPHIVYPALDLPSVQGLGRGINVWVLDHMDIPTSVFPSGHVAVAFSAALGMFGAVKERPVLWGGMFVFAALVYIATIYCRYHYAVDGLASILLVSLVSSAVRAGGQRD